MRNERLTPGPTGFIDRRLFLSGAISAAALATLAACASNAPAATSTPALKAKKDGDTLNLYAWDGYFAPDVIKAFEAKYGITVKQTATSSLNDMIEKTTSKQPFDIAIQNSTFLPQVASAGLLHTIDHDHLTNWDQVITYFNDPYFDKGAKHSVGYAMAPVGLAYRTDVFTGMTGSWTDLWNQVDVDPKHTYLIDDYQLSLSFALLYLGLDVDTDKQADLDKAVAAIRGIKGKIGGFGSIDTTQALSSGQATLIPSYTGNIYTALQQAKDAKKLTFELCKEGGLFNDDVMTIPIKAAHPGNGMLFLNYMLDPANMTKNVNYIGYPVPTTAGLAAYDVLVKDTPFLQFGTNLLTKPGAWEKGLTGTQRTMWNAAWLKVQAA
jgi:spermidine/putrescine-binding protein